MAESSKTDKVGLDIVLEPYSPVKPADQDTAPFGSDPNATVVQVGDDPDNSAKLMRTATWINTAFLLLCDILGPSNAPYSIASLGYVPGWYVDSLRSALSDCVAHPLTNNTCSCKFSSASCTSSSVSPPPTPA